MGSFNDFNYSAFDFIKEIYSWHERLQKYESIGSIEECQEAVKKFREKNKKNILLEVDCKTN